MEQRDFDLDPEQWATLRRLLDEALQREPSQRAAWLDTLDGPLADFKPRLRELLEHAAGTSHLRMNTLPKVETGDFAPVPHDAMPERIGPYRLLRELGSGGMASVWLAERTDMLQGRQVALKLPHGEWGAYGARGASRRAGLAERMAREREILATLNHPNIASLFDAGVADDGQPYLALEYVEGERIDAYCTRHALGVPTRLRLFLQAARAVAHAHANLVVHRDLKPSNILVNGQGEVRLLDFGIAKLLDQGLAAETELTLQSGRALTPDYASPEQIRGEAIGTASDIYSLGVVLHELLTGARPYRVERASRAALEEAILKADPKRPSDVTGDTRLKRQLRGDLDTIVSKALKKSAPDRYGTIEAMAADVDRHLQHRPLLAQSDGGWYRMRKFVARNRFAVVATASVIAALLVGSGFAFWQARVALAEKERAEEVKEFIASILRGADLYRGAGQPVSAAALLEQARTRADRAFANRPELRIEMLTLIGTSLNNLHEVQAADALMRKTVAEGIAALGATHPLVLRARTVLTLTGRFVIKSNELERETDALIPALRAAGDVHVSDLLRVLESRMVAVGAQGKYAQAEATAREMLAIATTRFGPGNALTLDATWGVVDALYQQYKNEALALAEQAYPLTLAMHEGNTKAPAVIEAGAAYGRVLARFGQLERGIEALSRAVDDASAVFGPSSVAVGYFASSLASRQLEAGQLERALRNSERALEVVVKVPGRENVAYAFALDSHAAILLAARRASEAVAPFTEAAALFEQLRGPGNARTRRSGLDRIAAIGLAGEPQRALRELDVLSAQLVAAPAAVHEQRLRILGQLQRLAGRGNDALDAHEQALQAIADSPTAALRRAHARAEIALDRLAAGDHERAIGAIQEALSQLTTLQKTTTPGHADLWVALARAHLARAQPQAALALLEQADAFWRQFDADNRSAGDAAYWLGRCHAALGQQAEARAALARAARILATSPFASDRELAARARRG